MTAPARASAFLIVLGTLAVASPPIHAAEPGTWSSKAPLSGPRENHGVIAFDGRLIVVGGNAGAEQILKTDPRYEKK